MKNWAVSSGRRDVGNSARGWRDGEGFGAAKEGIPRHFHKRLQAIHEAGVVAPFVVAK